jgi:ABC-type bacteriocin/lantibiotic exporter with double-glycine peptidase domain
VFILAYKGVVWKLFSGRNFIYDDTITNYGGIITGEWQEYIQSKEETCGQAAMAFFLSNVGIETNEGLIIKQSGTLSMLSLADLERIALSYDFKTQLVRVKPAYLRNKPVTAILHLARQHFIVFVQTINDEAVIFDPAYGQVYVSWKTLSKLFSGYMLYIYN